MLILALKGLTTITVFAVSPKIITFSALFTRALSGVNFAWVALKEPALKEPALKGPKKWKFLKKPALFFKLEIWILQVFNFHIFHNGLYKI